MADGEPVRSALPFAGPLLAVRPTLGRLWYEWRDSGRRRAAVGALTEAVQGLPGRPGLPSPAQWSVQRVLPTETDVTVVVFGVAGGAPLAVGRITRPDADDADLFRNGQVLAELRADERLGAWRSLLPAPLAAGRHDRRGYALEQALAGRPAARALGRSAGSPAALDAAAGAITVLHRITAQPGTLDGTLLDRWMSAPLRLLEETPGLDPGRSGAAAMRRLTDRLRGPLTGLPCVTAWTHGDYWSGNLLLDPRTERVAGIVDWGAARPDGLPLLDLLHLLLATRAVVERVHLGEVVTAVAQDGFRSPAERRLLARADWSWPEGRPDQAALVLLTWLGHVTSVMIKRPAYRTDRRWLERNVEYVLHRV